MKKFNPTKAAFRQKSLITMNWLSLVVSLLLLADSKVVASSVPAVTLNQYPGSYHMPPKDKNATDGWQFSVKDVDITVTHLGMYDRWPIGFSTSHQIAIWDESISSPLVSATISAGSGTADKFVYVQVSPVVLSKNKTYIIGAFFPIGQSDWEVTNPVSKTISPYIEYLGSARAYGDFKRPDQFYPDIDSFGPNFLLAPIPEPATLLLLSLGVPILARLRRKR